MSQPRYAKVDAADYKRLKRYEWVADKNGNRFYVRRHIPAGKGKEKLIYLHQEIIDVPKGMIIDHINHDAMDNRRSNLRAATHSQNMWNKSKQRGNYTSIYKGVAWYQKTGKWRVRIYYNGKEILIGYFDDEKAAAMAYDAKAKELFGEFAAPNLP